MSSSESPAHPARSCPSTTVKVNPWRRSSAVSPTQRSGRRPCAQGRRDLAIDLIVRLVEEVAPLGMPKEDESTSELGEHEPATSRR